MAANRCKIKKALDSEIYIDKTGILIYKRACCRQNWETWVFPMRTVFCCRAGRKHLRHMSRRELTWYFAGMRTGDNSGCRLLEESLLRTRDCFLNLMVEDTRKIIR